VVAGASDAHEIALEESEAIVSFANLVQVPVTDTL
jgi:hypothetical protein